MQTILTIDEVRKALYLDFDYDEAELQHLAEVASSYLLEVTGYDFSQDDPIHPLAKQAAKMYVATIFYSGENYKKEFDFTYGLRALIHILEDIGKKSKEDSDA